jgi:hypothetical protein
MHATKNNENMILTVGISIKWNASILNELSFICKYITAQINTDNIILYLGKYGIYSVHLMNYNLFSTYE